jgi:hypothetical protein
MFFGTVQTSKPVLVVGQAYQGGIITYILVNGDPGYSSTVQHGIIAGTADLSTASGWSVTNTSTGATAIAVTYGGSNTDLVYADQGTSGNYASRYCIDSSAGGYTDWKLPSINELATIYTNRVAIGGLIQNFYWSSSESSSTIAYYYKFNAPAGQSTGLKSSSLAVRPIRYF